VGATASLSTLYPYRRVPDQDADDARRHPVVIVGAGPVGLALGVDLVKRGVPVLILDKHDGVGEGSRAICFARHTLEIAHRLGCGQRMADKGVVWETGRVFHGEHPVFEFDLSPEGGYRMPAFVNLQQPYVEAYLVDAIREAAASGLPIEIRGCNRVTRLHAGADHVAINVQTPDGDYQIEADWLIACDGARSATRDLLGLGFEGRVFEDNFLIADVKMNAGFPAERRFWFEPVFGQGAQSALLHKQPDDIWRLDFQLGWDIDRQAELAEERVRERVDGMLGENVNYSLEWTSIYTFQCRRMEQFRQDRVLFAGDAAHQVSPFGARGANSGIQDADNLGWKLQLVIAALAPESLLDSYASERMLAADENIQASTRSTDFLTPKTTTSKMFRNAVLTLAKDHAFARPLVNSGRLSLPTSYDPASEKGANLSCIGVDALRAAGAPASTRPGAPCPDVQLSTTEFLIDRLGRDFTLLAIDTQVPDTFARHGISVSGLTLETRQDDSDTIRKRYLGTARSAVYLIRPDRHIVARWQAFDENAVTLALEIAIKGHCTTDTLSHEDTRSPTPEPDSGISARMPLVREPNLADGDGFYDELLAVHDGLGDEESQALNARLVLILSNHIGDRDVIREALKVAASTARQNPS